ncbi:rhomboid family intramembrane serine protease GlpG [Alishewanella sp. d11]|uniref:rhomboid family intramembrane serine protease GlpG n=1 Tax=Alishewanella sp. d11 TaxID=3414030 RepID=UPI003BF7CE55
MHRFVEFKSAKAALLFADYCQTQGIPVDVQPEGAVTALLAPAEHIEQLQTLLEQFLQDPAHPRYQAAAWQQSHTVQSASSNNSWNLSALWHLPVTSLVVLTTLLVYLWQQIDFAGANASLQLTDTSAVWRWVTPAFLHFSLTHLVFNLCWWVLLGHKIERQLSSWVLFQIMLSSAVLSNGLQLALAGPNFGGLSGVVYALLGYCWLSDRLNASQHYPVTNGLAVFMIFWLALGFMDVLWVNMANWAHLGGLLCGLGWAWLTKNSRPTAKTY